jgi:UPF0755 protein
LGVLFLLLLLGAALAVAGFHWWAHRDRRASAEAEAPVVVEIRRGDSLPTIARRLEEAGVAGPAPLTMTLALWRRVERKLQAGHYVFTRGAPPVEVLEALAIGPAVHSVRVTLPEGWTARQMAERLARRGVIGDPERFLALCADPAFVQSIGVPAPQADGFLFPDTYLFPAADGARDPRVGRDRSAEVPRRNPEETVIRQLAGRFEEVIAALGLKPGLNSPHAYPLSCLESVILASIVEREASDPAEMPLIAAVFHNRLRRKTRLESCATVRYALDKWDAPLTLEDLQVDSPFNTYLHMALPPAPICNPGRAALEAAFRPASSDYLYYVYKGNGHHAFSTTLQEHERLRAEYRDAWESSARPREEKAAPPADPPVGGQTGRAE